MSSLTSAFLPIEQSILAQETSATDRVGTFARFSIAGNLAGAFGALATTFTAVLVLFPGVGEEGAIRLLFLAYSLLGLATLGLVLQLHPGVELAADGARPGLGPSRRRVLTLSGLFGADAFGI